MSAQLPQSRSSGTIHPDAVAHVGRAVALQDQGRLDEAIGAFRAALEIEPRFAEAHSRLLLCLNYHEDWLPPAKLLDEHKAFARVYESADLAPGPLALRKPAADGRIRIGYLSPDLYRHSVSFFFYPVLASHDRAKFSVTCYADVRTPDVLTDMMRPLPDRWRDTAKLNDDELARAVEEDQIDILIELAGHTLHNRLPLLARRRLAPVQVTYLGYPNTTGLETIDYRITDAVADPPASNAGDAAVATDALHTERLFRLPETFFTSITFAGGPPVTPLPAAQANGAVTFVVMGNFAKIRPAMIALWARILQALPMARLMIQSGAMNDQSVREALTRSFDQHGIAPQRLDLRGYLDFPQLMQVLCTADVVLDTFPFNGHTSSYHCLWMGLPVVTLAGDVHRARMGATIMTHLGLGDLVARDGDDYVARAVALAGDLTRVAAVRASLRQRMQDSSVLDSQRFTHGLEAAYASMYHSRP